MVNPFTHKLKATGTCTYRLDETCTVGMYSPISQDSHPIMRAMATSGAVSYSVPSAGSCGHTPYHYSPAVLTLSEVLGA